VKWDNGGKGSTHRRVKKTRSEGYDFSGGVLVYFGIKMDYAIPVRIQLFG